MKWKFFLFFQLIIFLSHYCSKNNAATHSSSSSARIGSGGTMLMMMRARMRESQLQQVQMFQREKRRIEIDTLTDDDTVILYCDLCCHVVSGVSDGKCTLAFMSSGSFPRMRYYLKKQEQQGKDRKDLESTEAIETCQGLKGRLSKKKRVNENVCGNKCRKAESRSELMFLQADEADEADGNEKLILGCVPKHKPEPAGGGKWSKRFHDLRRRHKGEGTKQLMSEETPLLANQQQFATGYSG